MNAPTRSEIADVIRRLLSGELTRNAVSDWADTWLLNDVPVTDRVAWDAIKLLGLRISSVRIVLSSTTKWILQRPLRTSGSRGRNGHYWPSAAQIRTCRITASALHPPYANDVRYQTAGSRAHPGLNHRHEFCAKGVTSLFFHFAIILITSFRMMDAQIRVEQRAMKRLWRKDQSTVTLGTRRF